MNDDCAPDERRSQADKARTDQPTLTHGEFTTQLQSAIRLNAPMFEAGDFIDVEAAWAAYSASPRRFHTATPDNRGANPVYAFIIEDGSWWQSCAQED